MPSPTQWTILEILQWTTKYFQEKAIDSPRLTAEMLLAHALGKDRLYLYLHHDQPLHAEERAAFKTLIQRRAQGTPTQYLTGTQEFWSLPFQVASGVLIPRPETEHLIEAAIQRSSQFSPLTIVDIGTGSGIIAISLKHAMPQAAVYAGDISDTALTIARQNARQLLRDEQTITFAHGDLFDPFPGMRFDLIVSNPPYIGAAEYATLVREVREHEPKLALYGGEDGLEVYRRLFANAPHYLNPCGYILVEIGYGQKDAVVTLFQEQGFAIEHVINDYAGIERVIVARRNIPEGKNE